MRSYDQQIASELEDLLLKALRDKFASQGHNASGKGSKSLEVKVLPKGEDIVIQILGEEYMLYQETGRRAGKMPPVDALKLWVKQKGIASEAKEVNRIAWGIAINMKRIGMHSKNKRIDLSKRRFITSTVEEKNNIISEKLFRMFEKNFTLIVNQFSKDNKELKMIL